jgi:hypothetical protein
MKLKLFTPTRLNKPSISLYESNGEIRISQSLSDMVGTSAGSKLQIFQDEDEPADWYIKFNTEDGYLLHNKSGGGYSFNSKPLIRAIKGSIKIRDGAKLIIPVSQEPDPKLNIYMRFLQVH